MLRTIIIGILVLQSIADLVLFRPTITNSHISKVYKNTY